MTLHNVLCATTAALIGTLIALMRRETEKWAKVVKAAGIKIE